MGADSIYIYDDGHFVFNYWQENGSLVYEGTVRQGDGVLMFRLSAGPPGFDLLREFESQAQFNLYIYDGIYYTRNVAPLRKATNSRLANRLMQHFAFSKF